MIHGGDLISYEELYDGELIDFSSNINPLGIPKGLREFLFKNFNDLEAYPDIKYRKLKEAIGNYLEVSSENILVGNGAMEIIDLFIQKSNRVMIFTPSFIEYRLRTIVHGKELIELSYEEDFTIDLEKIRANLKKGDSLILGNPNNPTGLRINDFILEEIYSIVLERDGFLILDEAFFEFAAEDYNSISLFKQNDFKNLGIIRAATKFFALPGIRLGYGVVSQDIRAELEEIQLPWGVNTMADLAGQYIFKDEGYILESKKYIEDERQYMFESLSKIDGLKPYKTNSNYILIRLERYDEDYIFQELGKRGLIVRKCSSFVGLGKYYIRIAIKSRENNIRLIKALEDIY